jgi:hypothetical protein
MPKKYQKKPTTIEALQWTGDNLEEMREFCGIRLTRDNYAIQVFNPLGTYLPATPDQTTSFTSELWVAANGGILAIETGEWVAKDDLGYYPIKDGHFQQLYSEVTDEQPS